MQRMHILAAAAAPLALAAVASAQLTTDNLVYNFDNSSISETADWQSIAPGSNTTAVLDTFRDTGAGAAAADAEYTTVSGSAFNFSQAYSFDNSPSAGNAEARLDIDPSSGTPFVDSFAGLAPDASFEVFFRPDDLTGNEIIFETGGGARGLSLALNGDVLYAFSKQAGGNDDSELILSAPLPATATADFNQVVFTTNGVNSHILYLNGAPVASSTLNYGDFGGGNVAALAASDSGGFGGMDLDGGGATIDDANDYSALVGDIALFRAYNDVLTPTEVAANFASAAAIPEPTTATLLGLAGGAMLLRRRS